MVLVNVSAKQTRRPTSCRRRARFVGEGYGSGRTPTPAFAPRARKLCFFVFHFTGSFGVSEAHAESMASVLKKYGSTVNLSAGRVIEKAVLRVGGLAGDGSDDSFLKRCFQSLGRLNFHFKHGQKRARMFPAGRGSKPLHRFLTGRTIKK